MVLGKRTSPSIEIWAVASWKMDATQVSAIVKERHQLQVRMTRCDEEVLTDSSAQKKLFSEVVLQMYFLTVTCKEIDLLVLLCFLNLLFI